MCECVSVVVVAAVVALIVVADVLHFAIVLKINFCKPHGVVGHMCSVCFTAP